MSTEAKAPPVAPIMTPAEVIAWLKITKTMLCRLLDQGLPFHALSPTGRTKVFYPAEVQAWLDSRCTSRNKPASASAANPDGPRPGRPRKSTIPTGPRKWIKR